MGCKTDWAYFHSGGGLVCMGKPMEEGQKLGGGPSTLGGVDLGGGCRKEAQQRRDFVLAEVRIGVKKKIGPSPDFEGIVSEGEGGRKGGDNGMRKIKEFVRKMEVVENLGYVPPGELKKRKVKRSGSGGDGGRGKRRMLDKKRGLCKGNSLGRDLVVEEPRWKRKKTPGRKKGRAGAVVRKRSKKVGIKQVLGERGV